MLTWAGQPAVADVPSAAKRATAGRGHAGARRTLPADALALDGRRRRRVLALSQDQ